MQPDQTNNNGYRKLSHSTTLCNKSLQSLNLNGLCKYDNSHQAYLFEHSNKPVKFSNILVFLKQSTCYTVTPDTHQWYRINTNETTDNHNIAICNDTRINMVLLPPAEPPEFNAFETIARLSLLQNERDLPNGVQTQTTPVPQLASNNIGNTPATNITQPHNQSTVILQQFSMITEELKSFTNKVFGDITKITQPHNAAQENKGKHIENTISQALMLYKILSV